MTLAWVLGTDRRQLTEAVGLRVRRAGRALFGDRLGFVVFLAGLTFVAVYWRIGVFITDSYAIANTLVNVADGNLVIKEIVYSLNYESQPGFWITDGTIYGRNYGHAVLSLPVLWVLEATSILFDLRLVLAGGWSLLVIAFADQTGRVLGRHRLCSLVGCAVGLVAFASSLFVATPLDTRWLPFVALQLTTMVATAFVGVTLYRLLGRMHGRRIGTVAGLGAVVATAVGFWASLPKRHVLSTLAVVVAVTGFYFAREHDSQRLALAARVVPYISVALLAWVHPLEALAVFAVLVPVDLLTAPSNTPRSLAIIAVVFLVALGPFIATNYAISGDPFGPPRSLEPYYGQVEPPTADDPAVGGGGSGDRSTAQTPQAGDGTAGSTPGGGGSEPTSDGETATPPPTVSADGTETPATAERSPPGGTDGETSPLAPLVALVTVLVGLLTTAIDGVVGAIARGWIFFEEGLNMLTAESDRLYHTFLRSGRISLEYVDYRMNQQEAIELTVLETTPLLAGLAGTVAVGARGVAALPDPEAIRSGIARPERQTDLLVIAIVTVFAIVNISRLPTHAQITVRYLVPIVPLGLYGVARLRCVHSVVRTDLRWIAGAYAGTLVVGGLGFLAATLWLGLALGEAMQLHALVNLASAALLAGWAVAASLVDLDGRIGAVALALPAALTTLFLLFTGLVYFQYADYALPVARLLADWLPVAI
ncbi:hypothetical protein ACOZ4N_17785 [Halorientalis pallida]|uniref:hypothetical protein n=1 Tax=Halorientalis pallida TaxID=2479928 RepID=UPI003C6F5BDD